QKLDGPFLDEALCLGNPGSISVSIFNSYGGDVSFYYNNALMPSVKTGVNTYSIQIANPMENASLNVVNDQGCGFTLPISTGVPEPSFSYSSAEYDITGLLLAKEDIRFNIHNEGYTKARWDFGDGSPTVNIDPTVEGSLVSHSYNYPGQFTVTLSLFNEQGCSKSVQQTVQIGKGYDVMFPNVFSANADGINDYFQGEFTGISSFTFQIFDMWGSLVYAVAYDYNNMPIHWGWNGNYSSGKPYKHKSFRYLFVGTTKDNKQITKTGEASILR
ncbi:MAG: gliding motility-associated C-terminal domain-containing protein, partial [Arenibacter sp.]|nr:gliding motility-associated C-terminal domain-containing protein [Arenibacter sp.]